MKRLVALFLAALLALPAQAADNGLVQMPHQFLSTYTFNTANLNGTGEGLAFSVLPPNVSSPLAAIWFYQTANTLTPNMDIRIETDDGNGKPSGTLVHANLTKTYTVTAGAGWKRVAFDTPASISFTGPPIWVMFAPASSGTVYDASNHVTIQRYGELSGAITYTALKMPERHLVATSGITTTGGRSNLVTNGNTATHNPIVILEYANGSAYSPTLGVGTAKTSVVLSSTKRYGITFTPQRDCYLYGAKLTHIRSLGSTADYHYQLRNVTTGQIVWTATPYGDGSIEANADTVVFFATPSAHHTTRLNANQKYRLEIWQGSTSGTHTYYYHDVNSTLASALLPMNGTYFYAESTDSGDNWTEYNTRLPQGILDIREIPGGGGLFF